MRQATREQLEQFHNAIGDGVFCVYDVAEKLGIDKGIAEYLIFAAYEEKLIIKLVSGPTAAAMTPKRINAAFYSFDHNKTAEAVLDRFDPIPLESRTLEPQLLGEEAVRYQEVYAWRMYRTPPPRPIDRPYDQWEENVFRYLDRKKVKNG